MSSPTLNLDERVDAMSRALDALLEGVKFQPRPRRPGAKVEKTLSSVHTGHVLRVLHDAAVLALNAHDLKAGALSWYELKSSTGLNDDLLGLALNEMIPKQVRTRNEGAGRIYFLPSEVRAKLRRKDVRHDVAA